MSMAEICMSAYLIVGILATTVIWSTLVASKRRVDRAKQANYQLKYRAFREPSTKTSRLPS